MIAGTVSEGLLLPLLRPGTLSDGRWESEVIQSSGFHRPSSTHLLPLLCPFLQSFHLEAMNFKDSRHKFSGFRCLGNFQLESLFKSKRIWFGRKKLRCGVDPPFFNSAPKPHTLPSSREGFLFPLGGNMLFPFCVNTASVG